MIPYIDFKRVSNLIMSKTDIVLFQRCLSRTLEKIPFVTEISMPLIALSTGTDDSGMRVHKMNYEHFVRTIAEMMQKYASQLLS